MERISLLVVYCSLLLAPTAVVANYRVECEHMQYNLSEGGRARVCLRVTGNSTIGEEEVVVAGTVRTQGLTADGKDFTSLNMSFSQSYSPNMRGLVTLPCVEVVTRLDDMREDAEVVRVVIQQTDPDPVAESSCIVRILDRREEGVVETTPPHPSCGGTPQPQSVGGAIAGGVVGALLGVAGLTVVTVLVAYFVYQRRHKNPSHHTKPEPAKTSPQFPRSVVYKKNGDAEVSMTDVSGKSEAQTTPIKKRVPPPVPMDNPNYVNERYSTPSNGLPERAQAPSTETTPPVSPLYGNVDREDHLVVSIAEPEAYEIPVSLTNQSTDETVQAYEIPLPSQTSSNGSVKVTDHHYHTLEPPGRSTTNLNTHQYT